MLGKVVHSNTTFGLTDRHEVHFDHVRMHAGNDCEKTKGRSLGVMSAPKRTIVVAKAAFMCLAHELIFAMAGINGDTKYVLYRVGKGLKNPLKYSCMLSVLIYVMAKAFKNFGSYRSSFILQNYCEP